MVARVRVGLLLVVLLLVVAVRAGVLVTARAVRRVLAAGVADKYGAELDAVARLAKGGTPVDGVLVVQAPAGRVPLHQLVAHLVFARSTRAREGAYVCGCVYMRENEIVCVCVCASVRNEVLQVASESGGDLPERLAVMYGLVYAV